MSLELQITLAGLTVAGLAAVLGIWVERDKAKPPRFAYALSALILLATGVGMFQSYLDAKASEKLEGDLARMLATLDKIANESDVEMPELSALVQSELSAQARANPDIVNQVAQRVSDDGGDPAAMLGAYLPKGEVEAISRSGKLKVKPTEVSKVTVGKSEAKPRDRPKVSVKELQEKAANPPPPPPPAEAEPEAAPEPAAPMPANPMLGSAAPRPAAKPAPAAAAKPAPKPAPVDPKKAAADTAKQAAAAAQQKAKDAAAAAAAKANAAKQAAADAAKKKADAAKKAATDAVKKKADEAKKKADKLKKGLGF